MEEFFCATRVLTDASAQEALKGLLPRRLLVVADPYFWKNGLAQRLGQASGAEAVEYFYDLTADPTVEQAAQGAAKMRQFAPDMLAVVGGGSAIDCAKAMAYFSKVEAKLVAIPTTSGSGSEVTDFAILTHDGVKHPLIDEKLQPDIAILDGALLEKLPAGLVAEGGFDVLSHALESYVARDAGPISRALAREAFCRAMALLPRSYRGELGARLPMHQAAAMAGMAFSRSGLGLCHALSHALGGAFHVAHGRLNAILLPGVIQYNAREGVQAYGELAQALGCSAQALGAKRLQAQLKALRAQLGLPENLAQAGILPGQLEGQLDRILEAALEDPCCAANPVVPRSGQVRELLLEAMGNG